MVAWTATLLGFYMFMRKSNLVPSTMDTYNINEQFCRADINITDTNSAMMMEVRWSKTLQFKQKVLRFPVLPAKDKIICPVFWAHHMINRIRVGPTDPAFALKIKDQVVALSANQLIYRLRKCLL